MASHKQIRVALIGCGDIAEKGHVPSLSAHPRFRVAAVCDIRRERAELLAGMAGGVEALTDWASLADRGDIDAVVLALHPEVSVNVAIRFLEAGKAVLDEKPLAATLEDGRRLVDAVHRTRGVYQIGFVFSYCDLIRKVGELCQRIGAPAVYRVSIFDEALNRFDHDHYNRLQGILRHSSAITHEGSHVVDFAKVWNASPYTRVQAMAIRTEPDFAGPNFWSTRFAKEDGSVLTLDVGWLMPRMPVSEMSVAGPNGTLRVQFATGKGEARIGAEVRELSLPPTVQPWARQLDAFARAVDTGVSDSAPVSRGWDALVATKACEKSAGTFETVDLAAFE